MAPEIKNAIIDRVLRLRESKRLTQNDVAKYLGMKRTAYQYRESRGGFTVEQLHKLAELFCVDYSYLSNLNQDDIFGEDITEAARLRDFPDLLPKSNPLVKLTPEEADLLSYFHSLPENNQKALIDFLQAQDNFMSDDELEYLRIYNSLNAKEKEQLHKFEKFLKTQEQT